MNKDKFKPGDLVHPHEACFYGFKESRNLDVILMIDHRNDAYRSKVYKCKTIIGTPLGSKKIYEDWHEDNLIRVNIKDKEFLNYVDLLNL